MQPAASPPRLSASAPLRLRGPSSPPAPEHRAHSRAQSRHRPSRTPPGAATALTTTRPLPCPPAGSSRVRPAASGKPKAQARQGLKETGRLYRIMGSSRLGAGRPVEKRRSRRDWAVGIGGGEIPLPPPPLFQSASPRPYKLQTSPVSWTAPGMEKLLRTHLFRGPRRPLARG